LVQNRVAMAQPILPDLVNRKGVTVKKKSPNVLMIVNLYSPDNSRNNLRPAEGFQNSRNVRKHKDGKSPFKGVHKHRDKWVALIGINYKVRYLGLFATPELAHAAYCKAAAELHGEFANFGENVHSTLP